MIIDNRDLMPLGAFFNKEEGIIFTDTTIGQAPRIANIICEHWKGTDEERDRIQFIGVPNINHPPKGNPVGVWSDMKKDEAMRNITANAGLGVFPKHEYPPAKTVVLMAPGMVAQKDLEFLRHQMDVSSASVLNVVTLNRALARDIVPHYHMHTDMMNLQDFMTIPESVAQWVTLHACTQAGPKTKELPWHRVTWFTHIANELTKRIPQYHAYTNVGCDALQFAALTLRAQNIILLGFGSGLDHSLNNHYRGGLHLQAMAWWLSQAGVMVWNCSSPTTILAGVLLGSLPDAIRLINSAEVGP